MNGDTELLRQYAETSSEAAFTEFVERNVGLVYHAALRQLGGDAHRAEDVTQAVFTDVARKAAALARHPAVTSWLHKGTRFAAAKVRRDEQSRQKYEREAETMNALLRDDQSAAEWERLRPVIDDAIHDLEERDREAVLLRYFKGRSFAEVGAALRVSEDAARMRVDRALDKLRLLLAKRDITSTSAALATVLSNQAVGSAPAGLAASVTGAALSGAALAEAGIAAALFAFMSATKTTVTLGVAAALTLATAVYQSSQARTAAATLAAENQAYAAARARLAGLETKTRATEQALAEREKAAAQAAAAAAARIAAASKPPVDAAAARAEARRQDGERMRFLERDLELRTLREAAARPNMRKQYGPFLRSLGLSPQQIEQAVDILVQRDWRWKWATSEAGVEPQRDVLWAEFRAAFGDAVAERFIAYDKVKWGEPLIVSNLLGALAYTDEPFTAPQMQQMIEILKRANTRPPDAALFWIDWRMRSDWDRVLAEAARVLSPAQLQGVRAVAGSARMRAIENEANEAAKQ